MAEKFVTYPQPWLQGDLPPREPRPKSTIAHGDFSGKVNHLCANGFERSEAEYFARFSVVNDEDRDAYERFLAAEREKEIARR